MAAALALALGAYVVIFAFAAIRAVVRAPYGDPHDWDAMVFLTEKTGRWLSYLWAPHTNQRIVFARALTWLDVEVFGRAGIPVFLIATAASLFATTAVVASVLRRYLRAGNLALTVCTVAAMLLLSTAVCEDCDFPAFSVYVFVAAFAAMAFALFELAEDTASARLFVAALGCAVLAGFGNAAALAVWPVLVVSAARHRHAQWRVLTTIGLGVAVAAASLAGLGAPSRHFGEGGMAAPAHLWKMIVYFLGYCGLPWSGGRGTFTAAHALGLVFALGGGVLVMRGARMPGPLGRVERIGHSLILFGLLTAALATAGRVDELPQPIVPTRYFPFVSLLQVGLVLALVAPIQRAMARGGPPTWGGLGVVLCLLLGQQCAGAARVMISARHVERASAAFDAGDHSPAVMGMVYPDVARAVAVRTELKRRGLAF